MKTIGLTGGIASGKTTVGQIFKELGIPVFSADQLAHEAIRRGQPVYQEITKVFGSDLIDGEGEIDRKRLGKIVFANPLLRRKLEELIHPTVIEKIRQIIAAGRASNVAVYVFEIPLLFEINMAGLFDEIWVVTVPFQEQVKRLMERDCLTEAEAIERINSQMPLADKEGKADVVINNSNERSVVKEQVIEILNDSGVTSCKNIE